MTTPVSSQQPPTGTDHDPPATRGPEHLVRGFLEDVRSGRRLHLAHRYLAPWVRAHQGPFRTADAPVVVRTPSQYAEHVREMLEDSGPWRFTIQDLAAHDGTVTASWRQVGTAAARHRRGSVTTERGRATYRVQDGRITEHWIEAVRIVGR